MGHFWRLIRLLGLLYTEYFGNLSLFFSKLLDSGVIHLLWLSNIDNFFNLVIFQRNLIKIKNQHKSPHFSRKNVLFLIFTAGYIDSSTVNKTSFANVRLNYRAGPFINEAFQKRRFSRDWFVDIFFSKLRLSHK